MSVMLKQSLQKGLSLHIQHIKNRVSPTLLKTSGPILGTVRSASNCGSLGGVYGRISGYCQEIRKSSTRCYGRYEPDYLDPEGPQIATYEFINIQLTGYDYPILEEFEKFVHKSAERFGFDVEDAWGTPSKHLRVTKLKPESTRVDCEYKLQLYERNVQLAYPESTALPLFIDIMHSSLPATVTMRVQPHFQTYTEVRYVPDIALKEVQLQLDDLLSAKKKK